MVRSIWSTGGAGVDFIRGSNPKDRLSQRAESLATGLLLACRPFEVSKARGLIEAKTGRQPQFSTGSRFVMSVGPARLEPLVKAPILQGLKVLRGQLFTACALVVSRRGPSPRSEGTDWVLRGRRGANVGCGMQWLSDLPFADNPMVQVGFLVACGLAGSGGFGDFLPIRVRPSVARPGRTDKTAETGSRGRVQPRRAEAAGVGAARQRRASDYDRRPERRSGRIADQSRARRGPRKQSGRRGPVQARAAAPDRTAPGGAPSRRAPAARPGPRRARGGERSGSFPASAGRSCRRAVGGEVRPIRPQTVTLTPAASAPEASRPPAPAAHEPVAQPAPPAAASKAHEPGRSSDPGPASAASAAGPTGHAASDHPDGRDRRQG